MGGPIVGPDVRLDLDDPAGAPGGRAVIADEARPEQRLRGLERRAGEELAVDDVQVR